MASSASGNSGGLGNSGNSSGLGNLGDRGNISDTSGNGLGASGAAQTGNTSNSVGINIPGTSGGSGINLGATRGVSRVLEKLTKSVKDGNFYEAHQMYKTLYFRLISQHKYEELLSMLHDGAMLFLRHDQQTSGADLATMLVDVLNQSENKDLQSWAPKISRIFSLMTPSPERDGFLLNSVRWVDKHGGYPKLHQYIAEVYWNEKNYTQAKYHYLHSMDGNGCAKLLIELHMSKGYAGEVDLFIAQAVLQLLCLRNKQTASQTFVNYTKQHPKIRKAGPPYLLPLLNFIWFLLQAVESQKLATFTVLIEQYEPSIKRDPCYVYYLDKIGQIFFDVRPPAKGSSGGGFLGNFFQSFLDGLDDDSDDEGRQQGRPRVNTTGVAAAPRVIQNSELD